MAHFLMIILASCFVNSLFTEAGPVLKDKKGFLRTFPSRTMMFTGYYRPPSANRATNVYAQGNTVSGGTYFDKVDMEHPQSSFDNERSDSDPEVDKNPEEDPENNQKGYPEEPTYEVTELPRNSPTPPRRKLPPKRKIPVAEEEEEDDYEDFPLFVPPKGNRRNGGFLPSNTFFPMIFSFPGSSSRSGSSGSVPGAITAVANSYSTSKGGVASSVATAYGGTPEGIKRKRKTTS